MALLDMAGVASIVRFMAVPSNPELVETNVLLNSAFTTANGFGIDTTEQFLICAGCAGVRATDGFTDVSAIHMALAVFEELGVEASDFVDLDYAMTQRAKYRLIGTTDADLATCLDQIREMAAQNLDILFNSEGRPTNKAKRRWQRSTANAPQWLPADRKHLA